MAAARTKLSFGLKAKGKGRKLGGSAFLGAASKSPASPGAAAAGGGSATGAGDADAPRIIRLGKGRSSTGQIAVVSGGGDPQAPPEHAEGGSPAHAIAPEATGANAIPLGRPGVKLRAIDELMVELKDRQERGEHIADAQTRPGGRKAGPRSRMPPTGGNTSTTNIHVSNLSPLVTEEDLRAAFAALGPLVSVKVMWPRTEEERARGSNVAFVAFHRRRDAEEAIAALQGARLGSTAHEAATPIRLAWSRALAWQTPGWV
ncbi:hypothetical protein FNF29_04349 [Cafeteria roenbergensis]|uniref:RRM domain-containing protein n=1 Tax=Cafeteria roenbergensis TaxID=33653 RepID=A0A5A8CF76_CAFRO|nr:hypothetical protein FNF29_04349 [Cafeteria roenbergensis]|eukprot:KAA0151663.1 hypothetical protein FNF29_04349 [Cafeteria roenbergensis]